MLINYYFSFRFFSLLWCVYFCIVQEASKGHGIIEKVEPHWGICFKKHDWHIKHNIWVNPPFSSCNFSLKLFFIGAMVVNIAIFSLSSFLLVHKLEDVRFSKHKMNYCRIFLLWLLIYCLCNLKWNFFGLKTKIIAIVYWRLWSGRDDYRWSTAKYFIPCSVFFDLFLI